MWDWALIVFAGKNKENDAAACALYLMKQKNWFINYIWQKISYDLRRKKLYQTILNTLKNNDFDLRIWVATGKTLIWPIWWKSLSDITVVWDYVNLAARIESLNKFYKTNVLFDEATSSKLTKNFSYRLIDKIRVKWKSNFTKIYQIVSSKVDKTYSIKLSEKDIQTWNNIINKYFNMDFENAYLDLWDYIIQWSNDPSASILHKRLKEIVNWNVKIPSNWDWVFDHLEK